MNIKISKFPSEVIEKLQYYVYRLIDPRNGETFYVGKGKGNRVFNHLMCALNEENLNEVTDKLQKIREIHSVGLEIIHVIHRHNLTEDQARVVESALIDAYPGSANIVKGIGSNDYGPMNALEIINKYTAEEIKFSHKVLMITINKSILNRNSIYDATRFAWKLNEKKLESVEYVLAVNQGMVIGVFKPTKWLKATIENFPEYSYERSNRIGFVGIEAEIEICEKYLNKKIPKKLRKKGAANPIMYSF